MEQSPQSKEQSFYKIEEDMGAEEWLEDWASAGIGELEAYLAKHAEFFRFCNQLEAEPDLEQQ